MRCQWLKLAAALAVQHIRNQQRHGALVQLCHPCNTQSKVHRRSHTQQNSLKRAPLRVRVRVRARAHMAMRVRRRVRTHVPAVQASCSRESAAAPDA